MNILDTIVARKKEEVAAAKKTVPEEQLCEAAHFSRACLSLTERLLQPGATGIIAEFKRKSPSKGFIQEHADVAAVTQAYTAFGASGLSVLTDHYFFGGSHNDLITARQNDIPILRKDFMIDPYQVLEAKAMGADVILLIAACLSPQQVQEIAGVAKENGMEVLLELHEEDELAMLCDAVDIVGINNRSLKTFEVDIQRSLALAALLPAGKIKIAESGISDVAMLKTFRNAGYKGFLIGENFMKAHNTGRAFEQFVKSI